MADVPGPRCWGAVPHGGRGLHLLVQISCKRQISDSSQLTVSAVMINTLIEATIYDNQTQRPTILCTSLIFSFSRQNFKREEQNFVVMNEINNMSFLTADSKSKMSKVRCFEICNQWDTFTIMWSEYFFYLMNSHIYISLYCILTIHLHHSFVVSVTLEWFLYCIY